MLLKFDGHLVESAPGGEVALALFEPGKFDLVITDYSMPDMSGDQLAVRIKQRQPDLRIIMATAFAEELKGSDKLAANIDFILDKPFSQTELREAIRRVLP